MAVRVTRHGARATRPSYRFADTYRAATGQNRDGSSKQRTRTVTVQEASKPPSSLPARICQLKRKDNEKGCQSRRLVVRVTDPACGLRLCRPSIMIGGVLVGNHGKLLSIWYVS